MSGLRKRRAALLTQTSIPPQVSSTRRARPSTASTSPVSPATKIPSTGAPPSSEIPATRAPEAANAETIEAPMPLDAPVTTTRRPLRSNGPATPRLYSCLDGAATAVDWPRAARPDPDDGRRQPPVPGLVELAAAH